jgi:CTP:molybdopterin cytidylyltransferase MocA
MKTAAVVLAAGGSTRFGSPKQLARIGGETLLERASRAAREAGCSPVVVVLGASSDLIQRSCLLSDVQVLLNEDWRSGMGSSISCGVRTLRDVDGCVLMTCDMPRVSAEHLRLLMASGDVTASAYAGRNGVPAYFPVLMFEELMKLQGDAGARDLLRTARCVELEGGEWDVDTPDDLARSGDLG